MKLTVEKNDLVDALKVVGLTVSSTSSEEIRRHYLFRLRPGSKDKVEILSQSGRMFSRAPLKGTIEGEFVPFTLSASTMNQWINFVYGEAPMEFSYDADEALVKVTTQRTKSRRPMNFESLDPEDFFSWDKLVEESKLTMAVEAPRLKSAMAFLKTFISTEETKTPAFCVTELRKGVFYATDKKIATVVTLPGTEKGSLRMQGKDVTTIENFMGLCGDSDVEVLEHERYAIFRRNDGALLGEAKPPSKFPTLTLGQGGEVHWWVVSREGMTNSIFYLMPFRKEGDTKLHLHEKDGELLLGMIDRSTGDMAEIGLEFMDSGSDEGVPDLPKDGLIVDAEALLKLLSKSENDNVRFDIRPRKQGGWVRVEETRGQDHYLSMLMWLV